MSIRADLLDVMRTTLKSGNKDANYAARQAIIALDHDNADSMSFWTKHMGACLDGFFVRALALKPITADELKRYKQGEHHEPRIRS